MVKRHLIFIFMFLISHLGLSQNSDGRLELDSLIEAFENSVEPEQKLELSFLIGQKAFNYDLKLALQYVRISLELADQQDEVLPKLRTVENAGNITFYMGLANEAVDLRLKALELADSLGDLYERAKAHYNLGASQLYLDQLDKAQEITLLAQNLFEEWYKRKEEEIPAQIRLALANNLGQIAMKKGDYPLAESYFLEGKAIIKKHDDIKDGNPFRLLSAFSYLRLYQDLPTEAIILAKEAMEEHQKTGTTNFQFEAANYDYMGQAWEKLEELDSALFYFRKAYRIAAQISATAIQRVAADHLSEIFENRNQTDSALFYHKMADDLQEEENMAAAKAKLQQAELLEEFRKKEEGILKTEGRKRVGLTATLLSVLALISALAIIIWQKKQKVEHDVEEKEQKINILEQDREKLSLNIEEREKELTTKAMDEIQRSETMRSLIDELRTAIKTKEERDPKLDKVLHKIENSNGEQKIWDEFKLRFERTHQSFYDNLLKEYPKLTSNERRLSAFLRLDMSSKEIAAITGQSVRAIEMARIRLRKKLEITNTQTTLFEFLNQF